MVARGRGPKGEGNQNRWPAGLPVDLSPPAREERTRALIRGRSRRNKDANGAAQYSHCTSMQYVRTTTITPFTFSFAFRRRGEKGGLGSSHLSLPPTHRTRAGQASPFSSRPESIRGRDPNPSSSHTDQYLRAAASPPHMAREPQAAGGARG